MGNNASYGFNYTNPPNSGGGTGTGAVTGVAPSGGGYGVDKGFVKGKSPFTGQATYIPASSIAGGWKVSVAYTLVTTNGVTKPVVGDIGVEVIGAMSMVVGYQPTTKTTEVKDQTIYFTFDGSDVFVHAFNWHNSVKIDGTYNTATGVYSQGSIINLKNLSYI